MNAINTTTARIYADPDTYQDVTVEYCGSSRWFEKYTVEYCKVLTPLEIEPSDLCEDLTVAIAEDQRRAVRIDGEIEVTEPLTLMTLIKIAKEERDFLAKFCAECMISCTFYTVENNENLLQAEIGTDSQATLFSIGKMVGMAKMAEYAKTL